MRAAVAGMQGSCVEFIFRLMGVCTSLLSMRYWFYHYHSGQSIRKMANLCCVVWCLWHLEIELHVAQHGKIMTVPCVRQRPETAGGSSAVPQQPLRSLSKQPALHFEHVSTDASWFLSQDDLKFNPGVVFATPERNDCGKENSQQCDIFLCVCVFFFFGLWFQLASVVICWFA